MVRIRKMIHEILPVGVLQCNCSIFGDEQTREAIVIDPGDNIPEILAILKRHALTVKAIVITHAHIDHIGGAHKLRAATKAPVYMNQNDTLLRDSLDLQAQWLGIEAPEKVTIDTPVREGDKLALGTAEFAVLDTPGHTQGSISLWIPAENKLIAGDTLFRDSIGRTDLPGGDGRQILRSIHDKLMPLPDDAIVIPGHGETTTIGREKRFNYFLQGLSRS
jgi:glyoxylase-like metal-dependent hydrolase (beta-lactamase superfamily II)